MLQRNISQLLRSDGHHASLWLDIRAARMFTCESFVKRVRTAWMFVIGITMSSLACVGANADTTDLRRGVDACLAGLPDLEATRVALEHEGWTVEQNLPQQAIEQVADSSLALQLHFRRIAALDAAEREEALSRASNAVPAIIKDRRVLQSRTGHLAVLFEYTDQRACQFAIGPDADVRFLFADMTHRFELEQSEANGVEYIYTAVSTVRRLALNASVIGFRYISEVINADRKRPLRSAGSILVANSN